MESIVANDAKPRFEHEYRFIEEPDPEAFARELSRTLDELAKRDAELVHVSTQVLPAFNAGQPAWVGHIVARQRAKPPASGHGVFSEQGGYVDLD